MNNMTLFKSPTGDRQYHVDGPVIFELNLPEFNRIFSTVFPVYITEK